jgi:microcystin-dependent protein
MLPYTGSTAPNSAFVLPFGQAISRTTYVTYFSLVGTTYGSGDGSTTFNIIDMRGRLPYGQDNMGGSAAGRMTSTGGGIDGTTLGASGGNQTVTLARANLPNVDFMADGVGKVPTASATGVVGNTTVIVANSNQVTTPAGNASITVTMGGHIYLNGNVSQTPVQPLPPGIIVPYILRVI